MNILTIVSWFMINSFDWPLGEKTAVGSVLLLTRSNFLFASASVLWLLCVG